MSLNDLWLLFCINPSMGQTICMALVSLHEDGIELWTMHVCLQRSLAESPILNLCLALLVTHYRNPHFYLIHRCFLYLAGMLNLHEYIRFIKNIFIVF